MIVMRKFFQVFLDFTSGKKKLSFCPFLLSLIIWKEQGHKSLKHMYRGEYSFVTFQDKIFSLVSLLLYYIKEDIKNCFWVFFKTMFFYKKLCLHQIYTNDKWQWVDNLKIQNEGMESKYLNSFSVTPIPLKHMIFIKL